MEIKFLDTNNIVTLSQITFHQENIDIKNLINSKNKPNNNNASLAETEELCTSKQPERLSVRAAL